MPLSPYLGTCLMADNSELEIDKKNKIYIKVGLPLEPSWRSLVLPIARQGKCSLDDIKLSFYLLIFSELVADLA